MKMSVFNHKLKIGLFLILLTSILLCFYSLWNVHGDTASMPNHMPQFGFREGNHNFDHHANQAPPGRNFPSHHSAWRSGGNTSLNGDKHFFNGNRSFPNRNRFRGANSDTNETISLFLYSVLFLGFFAVSYYQFSRKNIKIHRDKREMLVWTLLGVGLFLRIAAAPWVGGQSFDINLFKNWAMTAAKDFGGFYINGSSDYPPLYIYILYLLGKMASLPALGSYFTLLIKLPSILADILTAYLIYRLAAKYFSAEISLLLSAFYIFNPAVFINSTFWGQVDSFFTLIVVLAVFMLSEKKVCLSAALFAAAVLMKPQGIIFLPVLFFELVRLKSVKRFFAAVMTALGTALVIILPFSFQQSPLWIFKLFAGTIGEYPYASVNAFNFFSLIGANYMPDTSSLFGLSYHTWGMMFIAMITVFSWFIYIKGRSATFAFLAALIQIAGVFTFSVSMHERYLFPAAALSLLAFIYLKDKRLLWLFSGFSATSFINTSAVLYGMFRGPAGVHYNFTLFITSLLNVVFFIYLAKVGWDITVRNKRWTFEG
jgi:Gpi18-like mannosyltransferase